MTIILEENEESPKSSNDGGPIWVNEFNETKAKEFGDAVLKKSQEDRHQPILVYIDSYGGAVDAAMNMASILESVPNKIVTVCVGKAMSAGAFLLSGGDVRFITQHSRAMIHEVSGCAWGNINDVKNDAGEINRLNEYFLDVMAKNCGKTVSELKAMLRGEKRELYLNADDAKKFGLVDYVGLPLVKKITKYKIEAV